LTEQGETVDLHGKGVSPLTQQQAGIEAMTQTIPKSTIDWWVNYLRGGGQFPPYYGRSASGSATVKAVMDAMGQSGDPQQFIIAQMSQKSDQQSLNRVQAMADQQLSFENLAISNFNKALKLSGGATTDWAGPWINKWIETGEIESGDPGVPKYMTALLTAVNEYARVMQGATGGRVTDSARSEAMQVMSQYFNTGQIQGAIDVAISEMETRRGTLTDTIKNIKERRTPGYVEPTEGSPTPTPDMITQLRTNPSPKMRAYFDQAFGSGSASRVLAGYQ
jgi:hypothetical protein